MSSSKDAVSPEIVKFHECVEHGSLAELSEALQAGVDVDAPGRHERTALMVAIDVNDLEKMKLLVQNGADPELTDEFNATALRHAVDGDFADGVAYLLSLGAERGYQPKYPLKKIDYDLDLTEVPLSEELKEYFTEERWQQVLEEQEQAMLELGQNPTVTPIISDVQSVPVLKLFLAAGDDLNRAPTEVKRALVGLREASRFQSSAGDYRAHKSPRYGTRNPQAMNYPFWRDMIRLGGNAYAAREHFDDTDAFDGSGPVWCYDRFGSSLTPFTDGRFVQIGGEHEDFYDPDFYIYNDVVVHDGQGEFQIYGYPREVFPPTDFHTATLVDDSIYVIGCLGYPEQREQGKTPVYRLTLGTWKFEVIKTSGEMPSWLHQHRATLDAQQNVIRVAGGSILQAGQENDLEIKANEVQYELDLSSWQWNIVP